MTHTEVGQTLNIGADGQVLWRGFHPLDAMGHLRRGPSGLGGTSGSNYGQH
jgi:hypothetical protein